MTAIVETLRNDLTDEQASTIMAALEQCVVSTPFLYVYLLRSETLARSAYGPGRPNSAAESLMRAIVRGYMGLASHRQPKVLGCPRANVLPWIRALKAGVVDAACMGLAIYAQGARDEDLPVLVVHLSSGPPSAVHFLAKAAASGLDVRGHEGKRSTGHSSAAAMVVLLRFAGSWGWTRGCAGFA
jgi:hypothetical protein